MGFFFSFVIRFYASQSVTEGSKSTPTRKRERERERGDDNASDRQTLRNNITHYLYGNGRSRKLGRWVVRGGGGILSSPMSLSSIMISSMHVRFLSTNG
jgi:hypothetical protein